MSPRDRALPARLVLATGNAGKLREMRAILAPWHVDVRPQSEFTMESADETGLSFVENAILKARFAATASGPGGGGTSQAGPVHCQPPPPPQPPPQPLPQPPPHHDQSSYNWPPLPPPLQWPPLSNWPPLPSSNWPPLPGL